MFSLWFTLVCFTNKLIVLSLRSGIKSNVPLSEEQELDEILDYEDLEADKEIRQPEENNRRRKRTTVHTIDGNSRTNYIREMKTNANINVLEELRKIIKFKDTINRYNH